ENAMSTTMIRSRILTAAFLSAAIMALGGGVSLAADAPVMVSGAPSNSLALAVGKSRLVELPSAYSDVMIGDPKIADIVPINNHSVYVVGRGMGTTALTVYGAGKKVIYTADVLVSADLDGLKNRLHAILPNENGIAVSAANQSVVVS